MKVDRGLLNWIDRKKERCEKSVEILKYYKPKPYTLRYGRKATDRRAYVHVMGEGFARRLARVNGQWKEFEHGSL